MNIYERLGVKTVINASDTYTALGGSRMSQRTSAHFKEAVKYFVDLPELQHAAGARIAKLTNNEAAWISNGAGAGVVLVAAACMAGRNEECMGRLPETTGMKNGFIVIDAHCVSNPYPHLIELAGGILVKVASEVKAVEAAINERTAGMFFFPGVRSENDPLKLSDFIAVGKKHHIPVIVDAAAGLPPVSNLWNFTREMGADAAVFSGGKHIEGPQTTGLILGKKELIEACALNASPNCRLGRPYKVGKEEIIAILSAVEQFVSQDFNAKLQKYNAVVDSIAQAVKDLPEMNIWKKNSGPHGQDYPILIIDPPQGVQPRQMRDVLQGYDPSVDIGVFANYLGEQSRWLFVNPINLNEYEVPCVIKAIQKFYIEFSVGDLGKKKVKKIGIISFSHETHGFWGVPTTYEHFHKHVGEEMIQVNKCTKTCIAGFIEGLKERGMESVPVISFQAQPAGRIPSDAYKKMKSEILEEVEKALPLDGLLINLHGAMQSENCQDCEGDILSELRTSVGNIPMVATLDLHANTSEKMISNADALVIYRDNPHVDKKDRGLEAAAILGRLSDGLKLNKAHIKLPLLLSPLATWTKGYPLKAGMDVAQQIRKLPSVINVGISGGYCYSDSDILGVSVVVYTDANIDIENKCKEYCRTISKSIWNKRYTACYSGFDVRQAIGKAVCMPKGPTLLADMGDNIGGGAPGDGTIILDELLQVNAENAVVVIADRESVDLAYRIGKGNKGEFQLGAKTDTYHGKTLKLDCEVIALTDGRYVIGENSHFASIFGREEQMGRCAVLKANGVTILVNEKKTPPGGPEQLRSQGIFPEKMNIIVAKSVIAFRGGYEEMAEEIIEVNTPGICTCDLSLLPIKEMKDLYYPLNKNIQWD